MALNNSIDPEIKGAIIKPHLVTADDSDGTINAIPAGAKVVTVVGVTNNVNDFITLPRLGSVPDGHQIKILCSAGANFELRTPASSNEKINAQDGDGTKEYLCTDTEIVTVIKINDTTGWDAWGHTAIGAKATAVVPD